MEIYNSDVRAMPFKCLTPPSLLNVELYDSYVAREYAAMVVYHVLMLRPADGRARQVAGVL